MFFANRLIFLACVLIMACMSTPQKEGQQNSISRASLKNIEKDLINNKQKQLDTVLISGTDSIRITQYFIIEKAKNDTNCSESSYLFIIQVNDGKAFEKQIYPVDIFGSEASFVKQATFSRCLFNYYNKDDNELIFFLEASYKLSNAKSRTIEATFTIDTSGKLEVYSE